LKKLNATKKSIKAMVCLLHLGLVFAYKPFSTLLREKEKEILWHICANTISPPKFILGLILIRFKRCKKS
jgi:hypothetical protein